MPAVHNRTHTKRAMVAPIAGMALLTELAQVRPPDLTVCHVRSPARQDRYGPGGEFDQLLAGAGSRVVRA